ncbi:MAG: multicomponent Na+:H+ antiporter subunit [Actinomycetota bacterium]|nr:multicomponent Na+:H+ antiporter subunit [Actinomycetota bacterium]
MRTVVAALLVLVGLWFSLSGAVGVLRMPDVYSRVQSGTKAITMGALPVLLASAVATGVTSYNTSRAVLIGLLIAITNPAASHALVRAAYRAGIPQWSGAVRDDGHRHEPDRSR